MTTDNSWIPNGSFRPKRYRPGGIGNWSGHLPFANDLIAETKPSIIVELGTHYGESYFGFCQAVTENNIACSCYAVDTWMGGPHSGDYDESVLEEVSTYNSAHYGSFSYLLRATFDEAAANFSDESIDILHMDGLHTYEAVSHDFHNWIGKVKPGGVVLFHDVMARHADFGVWRFWEELAKSYHCFAFTHNWGLGVFRKPGGNIADNGLFAALFEGPQEYKDHIRKFYATCALTLAYEQESANRLSSPVRRILAEVYPYAEGYSAATCVGKDFASEKWERFSIELPNGLGNGPLRIDPADQPAVIDISSVALRKPLNGEILWIANGCSEITSLLRVGGTLTSLKRNTSQEFCRFVSFGVDPQLFLPALDATHFDQPLLVEVWLRVHTSVGSVLRLLREADQQSAAIEPQDKSERDSIAAQRDEAIRQRDTALRDRDSIAQQHELLVAEGERWGREREALSLAQRKTQSELYVTKADLTTAQAELKELDKCRLKCEELERVLEGVVTSYSWRVTSPIRSLMEFLRRGPRSR
jgi:hypothetical protein